jgi:hypothetical protein
MTHYWTEQEIVKAYRAEHPYWSEKECVKQAKIVYKELNRSHIAIYRNDQKYYKHNVPLEDSWKRGYPSWDDILRDTPVDDFIDFEDTHIDEP